MVPDPSDPQDLNRYSYCGNNPVNYVDPTGHEDFSMGFTNDWSNYSYSSASYGSGSGGNFSISIQPVMSMPSFSHSSPHHSGGNGGGSGASNSTAQYGAISSASSFQQGLMNGLYTNFYSLTHDDGPSSQLEMVMGLIGLATDMVGVPEKEGAAILARTGKMVLEVMEAKSAKQAAYLARDLCYIEKYGQAGVKALENGRIRYYGELQPATNAGEMAGRRYVHEFNPSTGRSRGWHETLDHSGKIRQVRPELNNGIKRHYKFDIDGNYTGSW